MKGLIKKRKERGITMEELSIEIGVQRSTISMWENGKAFPRKAALDRLCSFFKCKVDDLL